MSGIKPTPTAALSPPYPVNAEGAKITLALGILSWFICLFIAGIPAIILGHRTLKKIRESDGLLKGKEMVWAGLILGYSSLGIWLVLGMFFYVTYKNLTRDIPVNEASAQQSIRQINEAEASYANLYASENGVHFAGSLAVLGPGKDAACAAGGTSQHACLITGPLAGPECVDSAWCVSSRYKFQLRTQSNGSQADYAITAVPVESVDGDRMFCSTSDGVIHQQPRLFGLNYGTEPEDCRNWKPVE